MEHPNFFLSYSSNDYICIFFKKNKKAFYASISNQAVFLHILLFHLNFFYLSW